MANPATCTSTLRLTYNPTAPTSTALIPITASSTAQRTNDVGLPLALMGPKLPTSSPLTLDEILDNALDQFDRDNPLPLFHRISDAAINILSYLKLQDIHSTIVNHPTAKNFLGPQGIILAAFREQLETTNSLNHPLTHRNHHLFRCFGSKQFLTKIRHLDLSFSELNDTQLQEIINEYPKLESLNLGKLIPSSKITDVALDGLQKLSDLRYISLSGWEKITNNGLRQLKKCQSLKHLDLSGCRITQFSHLIGLPLKILNLSDNRLFPPDALKVLEHFPKLKSLDLGRCYQITDDSLRVLPALPLQHLGLAGCFNITDAGLANLATLPLHDLGLSGSRISYRGIANLPTSLQTLFLGRWIQIPAHALAHLGFSSTDVPGYYERFAQPSRRAPDIEAAHSIDADALD
jgi:Leucine Rich repeat